jgi:spermidine/putrescine transport system permease protein
MLNSSKGLGSWLSRSWQAWFSLLMAGFMYLPVLVLTVFSFNEGKSSAQWVGFSLKWYDKFLHDERILSALGQSLIIGVVAVAIAAVLGTLMAVGLARYRFPGKGLYQNVAYLPLIIPDISIAVSTLVFLALVKSFFSMSLGLGTIIAAHVVFCLSYIALAISTRIGSLNPYLEEAAQDLGATPWQSFTQVLLPQLAPAILSGCLLAFVLSLDDLLIASFTAGGGTNTLPMILYSRLKRQVTPDLNALSVVLFMLSGGAALVAELVRYRSEQRRLKH